MAERQRKVALLTTTQLATRYGVSTKLVDQWRRYEGFPAHAATRDGMSLLWDYSLVDEWLRSRPISRVGRPPRWTEIVKHPMATG